MIDTEKILKQVKTLLGIKEEDNSRDEVINIVIAECIDRVINYCRVSDFPEGLISLLPLMAHRAYIMGGYGRAEPVGAVTSVKQGERTVQYEGASETSGDWMLDFVSRLEPYRRRKGRLPSECI